MHNLFGTNHWVYIIVIGFIVGLLARLLKPGNDRIGLIMTVLLGIAGALLAGWIGQRMHWYQPGQPAGFIGAILGAILILIAVSLIRRRR